MSEQQGKVTAVVTRIVAPGRERDFEAWGRRAVAASARYGAMGHTFLTPKSGDRRHIMIAQFPCEADAKAWDTSAERDQLVREAAEFSTMDIQRISGLEAWFTLPGSPAIVPPPRWKQLLVTLLGAYPLVVLVSRFVMPWVQGWPLLLRSAVIPIVLLTLMTYVVMPLLSRLFRRWLYPRQT